MSSGSSKSGSIALGAQQLSIALCATMVMGVDPVVVGDAALVYHGLCFRYCDPKSDTAPWVHKTDDVWYCCLCWQHWTTAHAESDKHMKNIMGYSEKPWKWRNGRNVAAVGVGHDPSCCDCYFCDESFGSLTSTTTGSSMCSPPASASPDLDLLPSAPPPPPVECPCAPVPPPHWSAPVPPPHWSAPVPPPPVEDPPVAKDKGKSKGKDKGGVDPEIALAEMSERISGLEDRVLKAEEKLLRLVQSTPVDPGAQQSPSCAQGICTIA